MLTPDGAIIAEIPVHDTYQRLYGAPLSWNPDGTLLSVVLTSGIGIFAVDTPALLRTLVFPTDEFAGIQPGTSSASDLFVAWSARGNAVAAVGSSSHPGLRLWGIPIDRHGPFLVAFGAVWLVGLSLFLRRELAEVLRAPDSAGDRWAKDQARSKLGRALFAFALIAPLLGASGLQVSARAASIHAMPSDVWFATNLVLSALISLPCAAIGVLVYKRLVRRRPQDPTRIPSGAASLGLALTPLLPLVSLAFLARGAQLSAGVDLGEAELAAMVAVPLGVAALLASRLAAGLARVRVWHGAMGLICSSVVSILGFLFLTWMLVVGLNVSGAKLAGEIGEFGLRFSFGFGLVPVLVAFVLFASAAGTAAL